MKLGALELALPLPVGRHIADTGPARHVSPMQGDVLGRSQDATEVDDAVFGECRCEIVR